MDGGRRDRGAGRGSGWPDRDLANLTERNTQPVFDVTPPYQSPVHQPLNTPSWSDPLFAEEPNQFTLSAPNQYHPTGQPLSGQEWSSDQAIFQNLNPFLANGQPLYGHDGQVIYQNPNWYDMSYDEYVWLPAQPTHSQSNPSATVSLPAATIQQFPHQQPTVTIRQPIGPLIDLSSPSTGSSSTTRHPRPQPTINRRAAAPPTTNQIGLPLTTIPQTTTQTTAPPTTIPQTTTQTTAPPTTNQIGLPLTTIPQTTTQTTAPPTIPQTTAPPTTNQIGLPPTTIPQTTTQTTTRQAMQPSTSATTIPQGPQQTSPKTSELLVQKTNLSPYSQCLPTLEETVAKVLSLGDNVCIPVLGDLSTIAWKVLKVGCDSQVAQLNKEIGKIAAEIANCTDDRVRDTLYAHMQVLLAECCGLKRWSDANPLPPSVPGDDTTCVVVDAASANKDRKRERSPRSPQEQVKRLFQGCFSPKGGPLVKEKTGPHVSQQRWTSAQLRLLLLAMATCGGSFSWEKVRENMGSDYAMVSDDQLSSRWSALKTWYDNPEVVKERFDSDLVKLIERVMELQMSKSNVALGKKHF